MLKGKKTGTTAVLRPHRWWKSLFRLVLAVVLVVALLLFGINTYVCIVASGNMISVEQANSDKKVDAILVLGCGVHSTTPSLMLKERLDTAISLYNSGVAKKLLMSGDHGGEFYNEVGVMKVYAMEQGVPSEDIFMDHAGFSTYESLYRAKSVFGCDDLVVVTQKYHLYRTVYLGKSLKLNIKGVSAVGVRSPGQLYRDAREVLARNKDFVTAITKPLPKTPLGEPIDISGDGNVTNDAAFLSMIEKRNLNRVYS